jgi:hypothetical protein
MAQHVKKGGGAQRTMSPEQHRRMAEHLNHQARMAIRRNALPRRMPIAAFQQANGAVITAQNYIANIQPQPIGLITKLIVEVNALITNGTGATITLTPLGIANLISRIQFNDLQNNQRINTTGAHLALLSSIRRRGVFGAPLAFVTPAGNAVNNLGALTMGSYGNNWPPITGSPQNGIVGTKSGSQTIGISGTDTIFAMYEIPIAYSMEDLTGAIYANVNNAAMQLQLQFNVAPIVGTAADPTNAIYQGAGVSPTMSVVNVTVYQEFYDQLPEWGADGKRQPILPPLDVATIYGIYDTPLTSLIVNQPYPIPYANFRDFLSLIVQLNNETAGSYPTAGSDVSTIQLQSANFTNIWQQDPFITVKDTRDMLSDDLPIPHYYFDHRKRPIASTQQGNMQLQLTPLVVNTNANIRAMFEFFSRINTITGAASLPAN